MGGGNHATVIGGDQFGGFFQVFDHPLAGIGKQVFGVLVEVADVDSGADIDGAGIGLQPSGNHVHQGRFADAVGANDADAIVRRKGVGKVFKQKAIVVAFRNILQLDHLFANAATDGRNIHFAKGFFKFAVLHVADAIDAGLLFGAAGLGAALEPFQLAAQHASVLALAALVGGFR